MQYRKILHEQWELFLLLAAVFVLKLNDLNVPYFWDEVVVYARPAFWMVKNGLHTALPGLHPSWLFFGHMQGFAFAIAIVLKLFYFYFGAARLFMLVCTLVQLYFTYQLGRILAGRWAGLCAAAALIALPTVFSHSTQVLSDVALAAFAAGAYYYACIGDNKKYAWLATVGASLKETSLAFSMPIFLLKMIAAHREGKLTRKLFWQYSAPIWMVIGFFVSEKISTGSFTNFPFTHTMSFEPKAYITRAQEYASFFYWSYQDTYYILCAAIFGAFFLFFFRKENRLSLAIFAAVIICFWLGLSFFTVINFRYILPVYPLLFVLAATGIILVLGKWRALSLVPLALWIWISVPKYAGNGTGVGNGWEDTMQYRDMVDAHLGVARFLEENYPGAIIHALWPMREQLTDPDLGYVKKGLRVVYPASGDIDIFVLTENSAPESFIEEKAEIARRRLRLKAKFGDKGKWVELWEKPKFK